MSAKAIYSVTLILGIGQWIGEWDGNEARMEELYVVLSESESIEFSKLVFARIAQVEGRAGKSNVPRFERGSTKS